VVQNHHRRPKVSLTNDDVKALNEMTKRRITTLSDGRVIMARLWKYSDSCRSCAMHDDCGDVQCNSDSGHWFFVEVSDE